jgi:NAD(P)H dehydrogenase (quinone)
MRVVIVFDHPYTLASAANVVHQRSFTAAVSAAAIRGLQKAGHEVDVIDLAADGFTPAMSRQDLLDWRLHEMSDPVIVDYQRRVALADHLVFAFPIWWEAMPAATKGFLDRVITKEFAFREDPQAKGNPFTNLLTRLRGVTLLTIMTTPDKAYRWWYRDPITKIMFKGTFAKIGVKNLAWRNYASITDRTPEQRQAMLDATVQYFARLSCRRSTSNPAC